MRISVVGKHNPILIIFERSREILQGPELFFCNTNIREKRVRVGALNDVKPNDLCTKSPCSSEQLSVMPGPKSHWSILPSLLRTVPDRDDQHIRQCPLPAQVRETPINREQFESRLYIAAAK